MKIFVITLCVFFSCQHVFSQYLDPSNKSDCVVSEVDTSYSNYLIAYKDGRHCSTFEIDTSISGFYTLLVYNEQKRDEIIYQASFIDNKYHGLEVYNTSIPDEIRKLTDPGVTDPNGKIVITYNLGHIKTLHYFLESGILYKKNIYDKSGNFKKREIYNRHNGKLEETRFYKKNGKLKRVKKAR